ncbi:hypothetical protein [Amphibacillus marinus]|uniref:hypothetical protein n=1 Tax=Amphibacillus marinus TaxID=872970 RepID=UPI0015A692DA|nr:hypothetical protein [Amphibacillus marinus]
MNNKQCKIDWLLSTLENLEQGDVELIHIEGQLYVIRCAERQDILEFVKRK